LATSQSAPKAAVAAWNKSLVRQQLPGAGCFEADYPAAAWSRIACSTSPDRSGPNEESSGIEPAAGGNHHGGTYKIYTAPVLMQEAIGSFPAVKGVKSVSSIGTSGYRGKGSYGLQLNTDFFKTAACANRPRCQGWEQFVFSNRPSTSKGSVEIEDWLLGWGSSASCPANQGWIHFKNGSCEQYSKFISLPQVPITQLGDIALMGFAASSGDGVILTVGKKMYGLKKVQGDGLTDLSQNWKVAEFDVFGNAGGSEAVFNSGTSLTVRLEADTGMYNSAPPTCELSTSTTAESNDLTYVAPPPKPAAQEFPSIVFRESYPASIGSTPACVALPGT
jgi:hypothetical protein